MINNAAQWILEHSKIEFLDSFVVNGITFELMSLSKENIAAARVLTSSKDVIELAANGGIAINKNRMIEDESLVDSLAAYWDHPEVKAFESPAIMFSVGEKVCELSGLSDVLTELILDEEEAERLSKIEQAHEEALDDESKVVQGDDLDMNKVEADANEYLINQNLA